MQPPRPTDTARRMAPKLSEALTEHSPRLIISKPTLIRVPDSPTGWLLVIPGTDEEVADAEQQRALRPGNPGGPVRGAVRS